jgi:C4-dicarboxylate-specific signal transduction histidine kinase
LALSFPPGEGLDRITGSIFDLREQLQLRATVERTRAELEHALRAAALGELTGSIAHEVNQPLSAVMSYAHAGRRWLNRNPPDLLEARTALDDVLNAAQQASEVVKRVRKLMGKVEPERLLIAVDALVAETARLIRPQAEAHEVEIETDLEAGALEVIGDRILLQQVLVNVANNAVQALDAAPADARRILISTRTDGDAVLIEVEDTGPGFSAEATERAFQSFFTTKARGMGLGLSISRATVEAHGGVLSVGQSAGMGGARLRVSLPKAKGRSIEATEDRLETMDQAVAVHRLFNEAHRAVL